MPQTRLHIVRRCPEALRRVIIFPGLIIIGTEVGKGSGETRPLATARACAGSCRACRRAPLSPPEGEPKGTGREGEKLTGASAHRSLRSHSPTLALEWSMHVQSRGDLGFTVFAQPDTRTRDRGTGYLTQGECCDRQLTCGKQDTQLEILYSVHGGGWHPCPSVQSAGGCHNERHTACLQLSAPERPSRPRHASPLRFTLQ